MDILTIICLLVIVGSFFSFCLTFIVGFIVGIFFISSNNDFQYNLKNKINKPSKGKAEIVSLTNPLDEIKL